MARQSLKAASKWECCRELMGPLGTKGPETPEAAFLLKGQNCSDCREPGRLHLEPSDNLVTSGMKPW